jgi:hypothetical protein
MLAKPQSSEQWTVIGLSVLYSLLTLNTNLILRVVNFDSMQANVPRRGSPLTVH